MSDDAIKPRKVKFVRQEGTEESWFEFCWKVFFKRRADNAWIQVGTCHALARDEVKAGDYSLIQKTGFELIWGKPAST